MKKNRIDRLIILLMIANCYLLIPKEQNVDITISGNLPYGMQPNSLKQLIQETLKDSSGPLVLKLSTMFKTIGHFDSVAVKRPALNRLEIKLKSKNPFFIYNNNELIFEDGSCASLFGQLFFPLPQLHSNKKLNNQQILELIQQRKIALDYNNDFHKIFIGAFGQIQIQLINGKTILFTSGKKDLAINDILAHQSMNDTRITLIDARYPYGYALKK